MSEDEEDYLEAFNELVRENLVSIFVETLQGSFLPFGSLVFRLLSPKLKLCKLKASLGHLETIDALSPLDLSSSMINGWMLPNGILFLYKRSQCGFQLLAIHSRGFYLQMAICANSPWLANLVSELYADLHSLDPSIVGTDTDLVFFIINKVPLQMMHP